MMQVAPASDALVSQAPPSRFTTKIPPSLIAIVPANTCRFLPSLPAGLPGNEQQPEVCQGRGSASTQHFSRRTEK